MKASFIIASTILLTALLSPAARADVPNEDTSPPTVEITTPDDQAMFEGAPARITVHVEADDPDSGVSIVRLSIDGVEVDPITVPPFEWQDVELGEGMHEIVATAANGDGYQAESAPIHVVVFPASEDSSGSGDSGGVLSDDGAGTGDDGAGNDESESKGCAAGGRPRDLAGAGIAFAFAIVAGARLRRRDG
jgi:hypothetical protein